MSCFIGVLRHEFNMSIRRPGLWIAYGMLFTFFTIGLLFPTAEGELQIILRKYIWQSAGQVAFIFNIFFGVLIGIFSSDRLKRDWTIGMRELQASAPIRNSVLILAKYVGVLSSLLTPALFYFVFSACLLILMGHAPLGFLWTLCMAFLAIVIPPAAFVTAFSLVLSLFMPLRVYQILFVGYWFWGNYLNANVIPTLNGTLLTTSGLHAYIGYFGGFPGAEGALLFSPIDATLNLLVLGVAIMFALMAATYSLNRTARTL